MDVTDENPARIPESIKYFFSLLEKIYIKGKKKK
jgi:hypothetical protein